MSEHKFKLPLAILDGEDAIYIADADGIILAECTHYSDGQDKLHRIERLKKIIEPSNTYEEREALLKELCSVLEDVERDLSDLLICDIIKNAVSKAKKILNKHTS